MIKKNLSLFYWTYKQTYLQWIFQQYGITYRRQVVNPRPNSPLGQPVTKPEARSMNIQVWMYAHESFIFCVRKAHMLCYVIIHLRV